MSYTVIAEVNGTPEATVTVTPRDAVRLVREYVKRGDTEVIVEVPDGRELSPADFETYAAERSPAPPGGTA
jgi:hypothetical protein